MRIADPSTPFGYTLFCDDIRHETAGKTTLVGVYQGELTIFASLPATIARLALRITYSERPGESNEPVELRIYLPGDQDESPAFKSALPMDKARAQPPPAAPAGEVTFLSMILDVEISPLTIKQDGSIKVRAYRGDLEVRLGTLRIRAQPPAQATESAATTPNPAT